MVYVLWWEKNPKLFEDSSSESSTDLPALVRI